MSATVIGVDDAKAVKKYSAFLATDAAAKSYWQKKFMGVGESSSTPIQMLKELDNDAGEYISYDINMQINMLPIEGDEPMANREADLAFYSDGAYINQLRGGVNSGGKMTRKRTIHKLRKLARDRQSDWWARIFDELFFMYISGTAPKANENYIFGSSYSGFAGNQIVGPDTDHMAWAADATSSATIVAGDKCLLPEVDKLCARAEMLGGGGGTSTQAGQVPEMSPIMIDGEEHYVFLMNPYQAYDMKTDATAITGWLQIQSAAAAATGNKNNIFKGALGMHNNVVLHKHKKVIQFSDYGTGSPGVLAAARGLFLGSQACVCAFGSPGTGLRFGWHEETEDRGNRVVITSNTIVGIKKTRFNSKDYGVYCIDTAAAAP
ncbi:MAG: N4-gp56 family major capsid protein [bacterium]|nr:N4-gp56 family major capsid protein [bacterium]